MFVNWALDVGRFASGVCSKPIEQEQERGRLSAKKYRPPRPMGVKGGCSPQNNLQNLCSY